MNTCQPGIVAPLPEHAIYSEFRLEKDATVSAGLDVLAVLRIDHGVMAGLGSKLMANARCGLILCLFRPQTGTGASVPETQEDLWVRVCGANQEQLADLQQRVLHHLSGTFRLIRSTSAFLRGGERNLASHNEMASSSLDHSSVSRVLVSSLNPALDRGSFVAVQSWLYTGSRQNGRSIKNMDGIFAGRLTTERSGPKSTIEIDIERIGLVTKPEEGYMLRRCLAFGERYGEAGLYSVAYGNSLLLYEATLKCMVGQTDGVLDPLFQVSRPITGGYYWCPPIKPNGQLILSALN
ncbi:Dyp-type peroxidase [Pseudovibrio exalbescens]|uniref:Dyp-type peroxidase C-terminal domain-containing protein n=1 Tax=Pseudovibrio exalbescens TaxID=197461 RepID=A0A1U7JJC5_9HYPH|nr:Dyp-type peroxidase domain-containing protein [Pseudovibrio exalbescens]OKL44792.1 hypothetical protein A3843_06865 [Pseudovibrio exalbescens]